MIKTKKRVLNSYKEVIQLYVSFALFFICSFHFIKGFNEVRGEYLVCCVCATKKV